MKFLGYFGNNFRGVVRQVGSHWVCCLCTNIWCHLISRGSSLDVCHHGNRNTFYKKDAAMDEGQNWCFIYMLLYRYALGAWFWCVCFIIRQVYHLINLWAIFDNLLTPHHRVASFHRSRRKVSIHELRWLQWSDEVPGVIVHLCGQGRYFTAGPTIWTVVHYLVNGGLVTPYGDIDLGHHWFK